MPIDLFCAKVRAYLLRQGVFGQKADHYLEELRDHAKTLTAELTKQGHSATESEALVLTRLGAPEQLAQAEATQLRNNSWWYRHPWLGNITLFFGGTVASTFLSIALLIFIHYALLNHREIASPLNKILAYSVAAWCNFAADGFGILFLAWFGRRWACSWRMLILMSLAWGLAAANINQQVYYGPRPHHYTMTYLLGPLPYSIQVGMEYFIGQTSDPLGALDYNLSHGVWIYPVQFFAPLLFVVLWRLWSLRGIETKLKPAGNINGLTP